MIVLLANAFVLAVLVATWWAIEHLHLPLDLLHTLAGQVAAAFVFIVATTEAARVRGRHTGPAHRTTTTNGDTHATR